MDAMHGLCVECHEREALAVQGGHPETLNRCMTCHDVDWREDVRRMEPHRRQEGRMAVEPSSLPSGAGGAGK
jgi:hypothetical protein